MRIQSNILKIAFFCWAVAVFALFVMVRYSYASDASFSWLPNSEADLKGYKIHFGIKSRTYDTVIDVGMPDPVDGRIRYTIEKVPDGLGYFAATAYDVNGLESDYSKELTYDPIPSTVHGVNVVLVVVNGITSATFSWTPNSETDIVGYEIGWDVEDLPDDIWKPADVVDAGLPEVTGGKMSFTISDFPSTKSYCSVVAYDVGGNRSVFATRISIDPAPAAPADFRSVIVNVNVTVQ